MKYPLFIVFAVLCAVLFLHCGGGEPSPPTNFTITAGEDGITVALSWDEPDNGNPVNYIVYFRAVDATEFTAVDTVEDVTCIHDPFTRTGDYYVAAVFSETEEYSDTLTTIPVHTPPFTLGELNTAYNAAYGWDLVGDFTGHTYSMFDSLNIPYIDFYVTEFNNGPWSTPYYIASPTELGSDWGALTVPDGDWRQTWFTNPISNPQMYLPVYATTTYFRWMDDLREDSLFVGVYLENEGFFALVKFSDFGVVDSYTVQAETWFQKVQGLRLIAH
ncbi:MAG: fibronectin type III domain-containing protein [candidate division WOR-3 bacterium]|nr:MAG: fibronectin type III domain-containing protein [candidate division WOR-3 bacterium]